MACAQLSDDELKANFGGNERVQQLKCMLQRLTEARVQLWILTFGWKEIATSLLHRVNLLCFFGSRIIGRDSPELFQQAFGVKGQCISQIMKASGLTYNDVLFVDDSTENLQHV